jgi:hypothetical protein
MWSSSITARVAGHGLGAFVPAKGKHANFAKIIAAAINILKLFQQNKNLI